MHKPSGGFFLVRFIAFIVIWGNMLYERDFMDASAKNGRGDVVSAETDFFEMPEHRSTSVIQLKRAGHWFSTTLIETHSWEVLIGCNGTATTGSTCSLISAAAPRRARR